LIIMLIAAQVYAAKPKPCTLDRWGGPRPPAKSYGPDDNEYIDPAHALRLTIPSGRTAHFQFWTHRPDSENAVMIYSLNFAEQIAERGTGGGKGYAPISIKGPKSLIITGWHKDNAGAWAKNYIRKEIWKEVPSVWFAATEDGGGNDHRDFVAHIVCR
jgi:hypothetical protein